MLHIDKTPHHLAGCKVNRLPATATVRKRPDSGKVIPAQLLHPLTYRPDIYGRAIENDLPPKRWWKPVLIPPDQICRQQHHHRPTDDVELQHHLDLRFGDLRFKLDSLRSAV